MKIKIVPLERPGGIIPTIDLQPENNEDMWSYVQFFRDLKKTNFNDPKYDLIFPIYKILKSEPITVRRRISANLFTMGELAPYYYNV